MCKTIGKKQRGNLRGHNTMKEKKPIENGKGLKRIKWKKLESYNTNTARTR